jgi:hypothetical protein
MCKARCTAAVVLLAMIAVLMAGAAFGVDGWMVTNKSLPAYLVWEETAPASVAVNNTGDTAWDGSFALRSVDGPTAAAKAVDHWGLAAVPVAGVVAPGGSYTFSFDVTAPPISTFRYEEALSPTDPYVSGFAAELDCNWILAHPYTPTSALITTDIAAGEIVIHRFADILPGTGGAWAAFWIDELAGRAPLVVQGYPDGTYRPGWEVTRDQMAVYMARALTLPTAPYEGHFPSDVPIGQWAWPWIEALVRSGIVAGYPDGTYRPGEVVTRGQMAVYVARGIWGGMDVPTGPANGHFSDVADPTPGPAYWAYNEIEFTVAHQVVHGYPDGTYRPEAQVTRDQMAVFVWKGFVMPTGAAVVLAGPATCGFDPAETDYVGWTAAEVDPSYLYVAFDALRLNTNLITSAGGSADWDIVFDIYHYDPGTGEAGGLAASVAASVTEGEMLAAREAAAASGDPYFVVSAPVPDLDPGYYQVVTWVETGSLSEVSRKPVFEVRP